MEDNGPQRSQPAVPHALTPAPVPAKPAGAIVRQPGLMLAPPSASQLYKRKVHKVMAICLASVAAFLLVSAGLIHIYVGRDLYKISRVADDFVQALRIGDVERAYGDGSDAFKATVSRQELQSAARQLADHIGRKGLSQGASDITKTDAGVHAVVVYATDETHPDYYLRIVLDKSAAQQWQIRNFLLSSQPLEAKIK